MKGKWHAKITLSKLLAIDNKTGKTRLDCVTEKLFNDCILLSTYGIGQNNELAKVSMSPHSSTLLLIEILNLKLKKY